MIALILLAFTAALGQETPGKAAGPPTEQPIELPSDPGAVEQARFLQDVLPALRAREDRATQRVAAGEAWFRGETRFEASWPGLAGMDLLDGPTLRALQRQAENQALERARERVAPAPKDPVLAAEVLAARAGALNAEDRFAVLEQRVIAGLSSGLERAPDLSRRAFEARTLSWDESMAAASEDSPPEVQQAAVRAVEQKRLLSAVRRASIRELTIPGDGSLEALLDATDVSAVPAARSVAACAPLLPEHPTVVAALSRLEEATAAELQDRVATIRAQIETPPAFAEGESLQTLQADVEAAKERLQVADPWLLEVAEAELELAQKRLDVLSGRVAEDAAAAQRRADEARLTAEATRNASSAEDATLSALRSRLIALQGAVAEVYDEEVTRRQALTGQIEALRAEIDGRIEAGTNAVALPILDPRRQSSIDEAFLDLRATVSALYSVLDELHLDQREHRRDAEARDRLRQDWPGTRSSLDLAKLDDAFSEASKKLDEALDSRERTLKASADEVYRLLDLARDHRRSMRAMASRQAISQARRDFFPELAREVRLLPGQLASAARGTFLALLSVPSTVGNLEAITAFIFGSIELIIVIGLWGLGRRQMPNLVARGLDSLARRTEVPLEGDRERALSQLADLGRELLDALTALFLYSRLADGGFLQVLALLWFARAVVRAAPRIAECSLATPDNVHPALRLVTRSTEALAAKTLFWGSLWAVTTKLATYAMVVLLDADRLRDVVGTFSSLAFWGLVLLGLATWGPLAAATLAGQSEKSKLTEWASREQPQGWFRSVLNLPRDAVAISVVISQISVNLVGNLVEARSGFGWLQSALARRQIRATEESETPRSVVPSALRDAVLRAQSEGISRPAVEERLRLAYASWNETARRGLVSLIGQEGAGKSQIVVRLGEILGKDGVYALTVPRRMSTPEEVCGWLAEQLDLGVASGVEAVLEALNTGPQRVIAVDRCQMLFLRSVRGYAALQALNSVMTSTAQRNFWVMCIHQPSWDYLMGIAARLKLDAFRDHILIEPSTGPELAAWLEQVTRDAGYQPNYDQLATTGLLGGDEGLAERRARGAFWRLLSDASGGVPTLACDLWLAALSGGTASSVRVSMFESPSTSEAAGLSDDLLFMLTALVQHQEATADQLGAVLNQRAGAARATAQHLVHLGVALHHEGRYRLAPQWGPAVHNVLRQMHFLHAE